MPYTVLFFMDHGFSVGGGGALIVDYVESGVGDEGDSDTVMPSCWKALEILVAQGSSTRRGCGCRSPRKTATAV